MNVLYTCDNNYAWLMGISMISLFENNVSVNNIKIFFIAENLSDLNRKNILDICEKYDRDIEIIDVDVNKFKLDDEFISSSRWPLSAFSRLFAAELLPKEIEKIIYIDCDTIINANIEELYAFDLNKYIFLGVKECISKKYKTNIGLKWDSNYINAGVMIINLKELRQIDIANKINDFINRYRKLICYADQDVLNGMFSNEIGILHPKYNVMTIDKARNYNEILRLRKPVLFYSKEELEQALENPKIIHYTTNLDIIRPWFLNSNHPYLSEFNKYFTISPWKEKELFNYEFQGKQAKITSRLKKIKPSVVGDYILRLIYVYLRPNLIKIKYLISKREKGNE